MNEPEFSEEEEADMAQLETEEERAMSRDLRRAIKADPLLQLSTPTMLADALIDAKGREQYEVARLIQAEPASVVMNVLLTLALKVNRGKAAHF